MVTNPDRYTNKAISTKDKRINIYNILLKEQHKKNK